MGIPSYFRKILQKFPGCLQQRLSSGIVPAAVCFDFNCLIYRCVRGESIPKFPGYEDSSLYSEWQRALFAEIRKTVKEVWNEAGRPSQVYIAVDGVVPMAKIRQQRVRRFKSAWLRSAQTQSESFDTNAITPGSEFMDKLCADLEEFASKQAGSWEVSGVKEEGEGEHKLLRWLRSGKLEKPGPVLVYGLDADLILLSMLVGEDIQRPLFLLREKQEFGGGSAKQEGKEESPQQEYQLMNLEEFKLRLGLSGRDTILNYIGLMNLMGNDFLPHSITHKLNDNGHEYILNEVKRGTKIVDSSGNLHLPTFYSICQRWSLDEEDKLLHMISKKGEQAKRGVLPGMDESEGLPLKWREEKLLLDRSGSLLPNWKDLYWTWIHPDGRTPEMCKRVCSEYIYGAQWILDYYSGKPVNTNWMFPAWIPPLWSDFGTVAGDIKTVPECSTVPELAPLPEEQLAMVLPLESWGLIRNRELRKLPALAPQYWPVQFSFFSAGRKWLWECEALVPPLTAGRLREILKSKKQ